MEITNGEIGTTPAEGMDKEQEFQNYLLKTTIVEIGMISTEGSDFYMTVYVRTINGKTMSTKCEKRQSISRIKDEIERKTKIPKALQHLSNQGKILNERKSIQENNIVKETTLEMTLKLQGGMKEDDTMNAAGSIEERNLRRKHIEIGDTPISDDPQFSNYEERTRQLIK